YISFIIKMNESSNYLRRGAFKMAKMLIATCSLSGCTDLIADELEKILVAAGHQVTDMLTDDVTETEIKSHKYILIGTYTYSMNTENQAYIPFELEDFLDMIYKNKPHQ